MVGLPTSRHNGYWIKVASECFHDITVEKKKKANQFFLVFSFAFHLILNDYMLVWSEFHVLFNFIIDRTGDLRWIHNQPSTFHFGRELNRFLLSLPTV